MNRIKLLKEICWWREWIERNWKAWGRDAMDNEWVGIWTGSFWRKWNFSFYPSWEWWTSISGSRSLHTDCCCLYLSAETGNTKGLGTMHRDKGTVCPSGIFPREYANRRTTNLGVSFPCYQFIMSLGVRGTLPAPISTSSGHQVSSVVSPKGLPLTLDQPNPLVKR